MKQYNSARLVLGVFIAVLVLGCSKPASPSKTDSLVIAITKDENTLTPYTYSTGSPGLDVLRLVYDSLFTLDLENQVIPWMVDTYETDAAYQTYTFSLKKGLWWHDQKPVKPEDVQFSFEYPRTQNQSRWKRIVNMVESVAVSDEGLITLRLKQANPNFFREGLADLPIIPKHIFEGVQDAVSVEQSPGSGMYRLLEYRPGEYYRFEAVQNYFAGTASVPYINMPIMTDPSSVLQALLSGAISASTGSIAPETVDTFSKSAGISILSGRGYAPTLLYINCEREALKDAAFRTAIDLAIDKQAIINTVMQGYASFANPGFVTDDAPEYGGNKPVYDPQEANNILDRLGYTPRNAQGIRQKDGSPLTFTILVYAGNALRIRAAELIAADLDAVGIHIAVSALEADTVDDYMWPDFDVAQGRNFDMGMWGWSAPVQLNPASVVSLGYSDPVKGNLNIGGYTNQNYDALCVDYLNAQTMHEKTAFSKEMQQMLADEILFVNLYYQDIIAAVHTQPYKDWKMQKGIGVINKFSFLNQ